MPALFECMASARVRWCAAAEPMACSARCAEPRPAPATNLGLCSISQGHTGLGSSQSCLSIFRSTRPPNLTPLRRADPQSAGGPLGRHTRWSFPVKARGEERPELIGGPSTCTAPGGADLDIDGRRHREAAFVPVPQGRRVSGGCRVQVRA
jgi:hypothetical protein